MVLVLGVVLEDGAWDAGIQRLSAHEGEEGIFSLFCCHFFQFHPELNGG